MERSRGRTGRPGARWSSESPDGVVYLDGEIIEIDPPRRLVQTFHVVHRELPAADAPSRLTWEIEATGEACRLVLTHEDIPEATAAYVTGGWDYLDLRAQDAPRDGTAPVRRLVAAATLHARRRA